MQLVLQTRLPLSPDVLWTTVQTRAADYFGQVGHINDLEGWEAACTVMAQCSSSPHLNPFQNGVEVTFGYGQWLAASPSALQAYYSDSYLGRLSDCLSGGTCAQQVPEDLQACPQLDCCGFTVFKLTQHGFGTASLAATSLCLWDAECAQPCSFLA